MLDVPDPNPVLGTAHIRATAVPTRVPSALRLAATHAVDAATSGPWPARTALTLVAEANTLSRTPT